jgi:RND family efflux transporter MFP subunit
MAKHMRTQIPRGSADIPVCCIADIPVGCGPEWRRAPVSGIARQAGKPAIRQTGMSALRTLPFVLISAVLAGLLAGCGHKETHPASAPELPAVAVHTQTVESKKFTSTEEVVGTVRAKLRATLEAKVSGRINEMPVVLGQRVKAGQLLARLDAAEIAARLEQAQAGLEQAERDWKRNSALLEQKAVTRSDYDAANSRYLVAKAAVAEAQAMLAYVQVLAPFDGVVTRKWVDRGDLAAPGKPLVEMEEPSALQLEADVPEAIGSHIQDGARMALRVDTLEHELSGTVSEVAPTSDPLSRTFRVKLDLPEAPALRSGQFARLLVPVGESVSMRVPATAVLQRGQMELVMAVENQHARLHLVKTGRHIGQETEILSGLDAGDAVVVEGAAQLVDGQPVTLK